MERRSNDRAGFCRQVLIGCLTAGLALLSAAAVSAAPTPTPTPTLPGGVGTPTSTRTATRTLPPTPVSDAQFISQSVPSAMFAGEPYMVSVTMRNIGATTWTAAQFFRLGAINPYDNTMWGPNRIGLAAGDSIAPGQQKTFTWSIIAPSSAGVHNFQWRMVQDGVTWFGDNSTNVAVTVSTGPNAAFGSQAVPATMTAGQSYAVTLTMRNVGGSTWTPVGLYRLGAINPYDNVIWGTNRVGLSAGDSIARGQQMVFMWTVTAPTSPGMYNFQWRMVQDGVTWFGDNSTNVVVTVNPSTAPDAVFVGQSVTAPMLAGQPYTVSVTMRNSGGTTWTAASLYRLGAINPYDNSTWGPNRIGLAAGDSIAPGQQKTFTWTVTGPGPPATRNFQWRMVQDGVTWFGTPSTTLPINVGAPSVLGASSLRFFGTGSGDVDRVKIPLDAPARPVDVGGDFTLEFWMKTASGNASGACTTGDGDWMNGNVMFDRDVLGSGDFGEYGVSLSGSTLAFGVDRLGTGTTLCGAVNVADGAWHHVALTRATSSGQLRIFVDGQIDATGTGPTGDVSYHDGRATTQPTSDPYLVIGAEKRDTGAAYHGWIDEVRLSNVIRYGAAFSRPSTPFVSDAHTAALYHFDEGNGNVIFDDSAAAGGPSNGVRAFGGPSSGPQGPQWSPDVPFATGTPSITLQTLTTALTSPTSITQCGDTRLFITEQGGAVRIWDGTQVLPTPFLTVAPITSGGEEGLLSVAFHPNYAQNGLFYVYYTNASGNPTIARYHVSADPNIADPSSGVVLLSVPHPGQSNHNGGQLQFGPDGYLYAGTGDGGGGCDNSGPGCNSQRDNSLLGKMLRLDVDQNVNTAPYYGIPPTNPFVGPGDPLDEIWAKGLRNPFRFSFDGLTGSLFIGDVGQNTREEVDVQVAGSAGGQNYGWKRMEGFLCNTCDLSDCPVAPPPCDDPSLTLPVLDYGHNPECAIIGGYVYRGVQIPFLYGKYLYTDLCSGRMWWANDHEGTWTPTLFAATASQPWSFGRDVNGELYVVQGDGTLAAIRQGP